MRLNWCLPLIALALIMTGCSEGRDVASRPRDNLDGDDATMTRYEATTEPAGAVPVGEARENSQDGQEITLVGVIGGSSKPFVEGLAAFTVVDPRVPYCAPDEGCPTPWDYCCTQDQVKDNVATVKIVDGSGKPVARDAREFLHVKELTTVVVTGKAKRDDQGNLTVVANKVFVRTGK